MNALTTIRESTKKRSSLYICVICDDVYHFHCLDKKHRTNPNGWQCVSCKKKMNNMTREVYGLNPYHKRLCYIHEPPDVILSGCGRLLCQGCLKSMRNKIHLDDRDMEEYVKHLLSTYETHTVLPEPANIISHVKPIILDDADVMVIEPSHDRIESDADDTSSSDLSGSDDIPTDNASRKRKRLENGSQDNYNAVAKKDSPNKLYANGLFMQALTRIIIDGKGERGNLFILDAVTFLTSRMACLYGYKPHQISVPNNGGDVDQMMLQSGRYCMVHKMSALDFISQSPKPGPFQGVFLDYCGTSKSFKEDIIRLFTRHLLCEESILACTFSKRVSGGWIEDREYIYKKIKKHSKRSEYNVQQIYEDDYSSMYYFGFRIRKF